MIRVNQVNKSFDGFHCLKDLSMTVPTGSVYGMVGPNGVGKSTVLRHLAGVYRPDSGEIEVDGQPVFENREVKGKIFTIPDELYYFTSASTRDMMKFFRGIYPKFDLQRYEALREAFPEVKETGPIRRLSKGTQKQAWFWLALSCRPEVLLLDEPVDGLDPVMRRQVWSLMLQDVAVSGTTVVVSSHNLRELEDVCDHVGILAGGTMMIERSLQELQGNVVKMQVVFQEKTLPEFPEDMKILHVSQVGRITTLIIRGTAEETTNRLAVYSPLLLEALPLSLEEIFIYELGGEREYAVRDIIL